MGLRRRPELDAMPAPGELGRQRERVVRQARVPRLVVQLDDLHAPAVAARSESSARAASHTCWVAISLMQRKCPAGQERAPCSPQGRQARSASSTRWPGPYGKKPSSRVVAPKIASVGTPEPAAKCIGPESLVTNRESR